MKTKERRAPARHEVDHNDLAIQLFRIGQAAGIKLSPPCVQWHSWNELKPWVRMAWLGVARHVAENYELKQKGGAK